MASIDEGVDSIQATPDVPADVGSVTHAFRYAERDDWAWLLQMLAQTVEFGAGGANRGHAKFWYAVFQELNRHLPARVTAGASPANQGSLEPNLPSEIARLRKALEWALDNAGADHSHYPYRRDDGRWIVPYLVSGTPLGGGAGEAAFANALEAVSDAIAREALTSTR